MQIQHEKSDILFLANIAPSKRGSFEDYMCLLAEECRDRDLTIRFVLREEISVQMQKLFANHGVWCEFCEGSDITRAAWLWGLLNRIKPKLVHMSFISYCSPAVALCRLWGVHKILLMDQTSRATEDWGYRGPINLAKAVRRHVMARLVDRFLAVSRYVGLEIAREGGVPQSKIQLLYNGVCTTRFRPRTTLGQDDCHCSILRDMALPGPVVLFAGQLAEFKGLRVFVEAAKGVLGDFENAQFLVAGAGELEREMVRWVIDQGLESHVRFLGIREDLEDVMAVADIFVCPSTWQEAFGFVIAEAMASGLPVVATRVGGIPELVVHEGTGLLVSPGNVVELKDAILHLLRDSDLCRSLGVAGRSRAEGCFSLERMVRETADVYESQIVVKSQQLMVE